MTSTEVVIFTNKSHEECSQHVTDGVREWLSGYLELEEGVSPEDLIIEKKYGSKVNNWSCDTYIFDLGNAFSMLFNNTEVLSKQELITTVSHIHNLLSLLEIDSYHIFKFVDEFESRLNAIFYKEISELELDIRRMLTNIFYPKNPEQIYQLLDLTKATATGYSSEEVRRHDNGFQNEFFYLNIGEYKNLNEQNTFTKDGLVRMGEQYSDLATFLEDLKSFGQLDADESTLVAEVAKNMDTIRGFRNCIMHSRAYSADELDSYQKAESEAREALKEYFM